MTRTDRVFITRIYIVDARDRATIEATSEPTTPHVRVGAHIGTPEHLEAVLRQAGHDVVVSIFTEERHPPTAIFVLSQHVGEREMLEYAGKIARLCNISSPHHGWCVTVGRSARV